MENCYSCDMPFFTGLGTKDNVPRFLRWNGAPSARQCNLQACRIAACRLPRCSMSSAALQHVVCHVARMLSATWHAAGQLRNRHLSKREAELFFKDIWAKKAKSDDKRLKARLCVRLPACAVPFVVV